MKMKVLVFVSSRCPHCPGAESVARRVVPEYSNHGVEFMKIRTRTPEGKRLSKEFGVMSLPTTMLLDDNGRELQRIVGVPSEGNLRGKIERALGLKKSFFARVLGR